MSNSMVVEIFLGFPIYTDVNILDICKFCVHGSYHLVTKTKFAVGKCINDLKESNEGDFLPTGPGHSLRVGFSHNL